MRIALHRAGDQRIEGLAALAPVARCEIPRLFGGEPLLPARPIQYAIRVPEVFFQFRQSRLTCRIERLVRTLSRSGIRGTGC